MKFKIVCSNFFKTLSHLHGIVDKKNSLPILSNILIEAKDNALTLSSTAVSYTHLTLPTKLTV